MAVTFNAEAKKIEGMSSENKPWDDMPCPANPRKCNSALGLFPNDAVGGHPTPTAWTVPNA